MGSKNLSIVFKAHDRMTESMKKMQGGVRDLSQQVAEYRKLQERVFEKKAAVKIDIIQAKQSLKELEKAVKHEAIGAEEAYKKKQIQLDQLVREHDRLIQAAKEAKKIENELARETSRRSNAQAVRSPIQGGSLREGLATAGLGNMIGAATQNFGNVMATSMFGSQTGHAVGAVGGGLVQGAAMGSIAGPVGAAVGAAVGGLTGAINALAEKQNMKDDLLRDEVKTLHGETIADMQGKVERGSSLAAERELMKQNYMSMTSDDTGKQLYENIKKYGDTTPYDTSVMLEKGREMLVYGVEKENLMEMIEYIGDVAMGKVENFSGISYAVAQTINSKTLTGQDRRQMVGWGFDPLEYIAINTGKSFSEVKDMMSEGKISDVMVVDALKTATGEGGKFHNAVNATKDTFIGMLGQLESAKKEMEIAAGNAYNETLKKGMTKQVEFYTGEEGDKLKEAYSMIGEYEAEMENQHQEKMMAALQQASETIRSKKLEGIEAQKVMWEAYTDAEIAYKNSEEMQKKLKAERDIVSSIRSSLVENGDYLEFGRAMGNEFSKGYTSTRMENAIADTKSKGGGSFISGLLKRNYEHNGSKGGFHATGLPRVPYDNYPALLHEGERVLTRAEVNTKGSQGNGVNIGKLADSIVVREDADIQKIASALVMELQKASETYGG